jgi:hypothetical protein
MREKLLLYSCLLMFFLSGCAGFVADDINKSMEIRRSSAVDTKKAFDESKVTYIKELRSYTYRADDKKKDIDSILFDAAGKKIATKDEAIEQVRFRYSNKGFSTSEKVAGYATAIWVAPVGLVFYVAETVAMLPSLPYVIHLKNKFQKEEFEYYELGQKHLEEGYYPEAREKFFLALSGGSSLIYRSDIYYKIAVTYDKQGNTVLSEKYYKIFLEYSIALYPDYFQERNPKLVNDSTELDKEFTTAEEKLNNVITIRSSPAL